MKNCLLRGLSVVFVVGAFAGPYVAHAQFANGGGGPAVQSTPAPASGAWPVYQTIGGTVMSATNGLFVNPATGATFPISGSVSITGSVAVTGTFFQASQPVSAAVLPLPAGAATAALQAAINVDSGSQVHVQNFPATQAVTVATLPLAPVNIQGSSSSTNANLHGSVTALGTSLVLKASAGNLYSFNCTAVTGGAAGYCVAYNGAAAPVTGALTGANVLDTCYFAAGAAGCSLSHGTIPSNYSTGVVILVTSAATPFTYTTGVDTAFISGDYQ